MSTFFENLPEVNFAEKDTNLIVSEMISDFEAVAGRKLFPADPMRLLILGFANYTAMQRNKIDDSAKQNLLKYAREGFLENLSALLDVKRLEASAAVTTLRFTISAVQSSNLTIPKGTRVTPGNKIYFCTVEAVDIEQGQIHAEVKAECTEAGEVGNNFYPKQINKLADSFPYFQSVENITMSQGGSDIENLDSLRERTRTAPESFSSAGPYGAYQFWAKTASQLITDVSVESPEPGVVEIIPLLKNGEIPSEDILDKVYVECNDSSRRPLTDMVRVRIPEEVKYNISLKYYISRTNSSLGLSIQNKVNEAVQNYSVWQKSALGRDINPSELTRAIMASGAKRVEVQEPIFQRIEYYQIALIEQISLVYGGLEDD